MAEPAQAAEPPQEKDEPLPRRAPGERDWRAWVAEAASRLRDFLVSQPAALHVNLRHPVASPAATANHKPC